MLAHKDVASLCGLVYVQFLSCKGSMLFTYEAFENEPMSFGQQLSSFISVEYIAMRLQGYSSNVSCGGGSCYLPHNGQILTVNLEELFTQFG